MELKELGKNIRRLRAEAGIGLRELSRMAGVSPASLVAIEKGVSSPTLATLNRVLRALGTTFVEFFTNSEDTSQTPVFSSKNIKTIQDAHRKYSILFPKRQGMKFEMFSEVIAPTEKESEWEVHECDLGGFILSGGPARLEIEDIGCWKVRRGDSFYIKAGLKHRMTNIGKRSLKVITVVDPPKY